MRVRGAVHTLVCHFKRKRTRRSWHHVHGSYYEKSLCSDNDPRCYSSKMKKISLDWFALLRRLLMEDRRYILCICSWQRVTASSTVLICSCDLWWKTKDTSFVSVLGKVSQPLPQFWSVHVTYDGRQKIHPLFLFLAKCHSLLHSFNLFMWPMMEHKRYILCIPGSLQHTINKSLLIGTMMPV